MEVSFKCPCCSLRVTRAKSPAVCVLGSGEIPSCLGGAWDLCPRLQRQLGRATVSSKTAKPVIQLQRVIPGFLIIDLEREETGSCTCRANKSVSSILFLFFGDLLCLFAR